jgi:capsular exopolysaccharide synthesis family protein
MSLHRNPLLQTIHQLQETGATGSLPLSHNGQTITVFFREGLISAVSTSLADHQLGQYLAKRGYAEEKEIAHLVQDARKRSTLLGETAVSKNLLDGSELMEVVQDQAAQLLAHAIKQGFEAHGFDRATPPSFFMPARIDHMQLMLELARNNLQPFKLDPGMLISLRNGKQNAPLPWLPAELSVLSELKEPRTIHELVVATGLEYPRLSKILFVFDTLQLLSFVESASTNSTAIVRRQGFPFESLVPEIRKTALNDKLETIRDESSFISEQFKTLKIRISELAASHNVKVITFSSPAAEDGKSLICLNLAASYARDLNRRVILLDCDLRNPSLHRYLGIPAEPGLRGFLEEDYLQPYCYMRRLDKLYILAAGGVSPNPLELLSQDRMRSLIDYLKTEFDTIIIDAPPLSPISDAQVLAALSDGLVLVVRSGKTTYPDMEKGFKNLDREKLIGVVVNDVKPLLFNTHYDHRYYNYGNHSQYPYAHGRVAPHRRKSYLDS